MRRILVIGDVILDEYVFLDNLRPSTEVKDGQIGTITDRQYFLGGAAAVASILSCQGFLVTLRGIIGKDSYGSIVRDLCQSRDIDFQFYRDGRPTTVKTRFVQQKPLRILPLRADWEVKLEAPLFITDFLYGKSESPFILLSDYGKGAIRPNRLDDLRRNNPEALLFLDPCLGVNWKDYGRVDLIKSNQAEWSSDKYADTPQNGENWVVTSGQDGITIYPQPAQSCTYYIHIPASKPNGDVVDVSGAGDTVFAILAAALVEGASLPTACEKAAKAAAEQITKVGIRPLRPI